MKTHHLVPFMACWVAVVTVFAQEPIPFSDTDTIEDIRAKIELNRYDFTVATNWVFNMSPEERAAFHGRRPRRSLGAILSPEEMSPLATRELTSLPSAFCWTNVGGHSYIGPIRDQGDCGSCYSFGACATAEGVYNYAMGLYDGACANFSESFIIWCLGRLSQYNDNFYGCDGADYEYQELQALTVEGICTESAFPYQVSDPGSCTHWSDPRTVFAGWYRVACNDINAIKTAIYTYGVVDAAVYVGSAFDAYSSGIYKDSNTGCPDDEYTESNHAIALVGWNDNGGDGYWILRNSWGTTWGEKGYMRISYQAARVGCAVAYLVYSNTVTPVTPPTVTTVAASLIATNAATLNGTVNPQGASSWYWFEYGLTTNYGSTSTKTNAGSGSAAVSVSNRVTGLTPGSTYHFRIVATNTGGKSVGLDWSFVTASSPAAAPSAITDPATEVTNTSALLRGRVNPNGYTTTYRFEYGLTAAYSYTTTVSSAGSGTALLSVSNRVTGLTPGTTYHFRVVATNIGGRSNGIDRTFTTVSSPLTPAPWAITDPASHITNTAATMNGTVNPNGYAATYWFEYGLSDSYGLTTPAAGAGSGTSPIAVTNRLTGLPSGVTYHFRVVATNSGGRSNGVDRTFTTSSSGSPHAPWAITAPATYITNTEATVNGSVNPNGYTTTYWFEYGLSDSYGLTTPTANAGSGTSSIGVTNRLTGLTSGKLYHFRVVATNLYGRSNGVDRTFATLTTNMAVRVFHENFEHAGNMPDDWADEYVSGDHYWEAVSGSYDGYPSSAHGGLYNALFLWENGVTRLVTPVIDFGAATNQATLSFWHYMRNWYDYQDELRVYYKTSAGGSWNLLAEYTSRVRTWTKRVLNLPNPGSTYYIAFEGTAEWGYGVCVDDVEIYAYTLPRSPDFDSAAISLPTASVWVLSWASISDRFYTVQSSTNLVAGFQTMISNLVATPPVNTYTSGLSGGQWRFYRIDERLPD